MINLQVTVEPLQEMQCSLRFIDVPVGAVTSSNVKFIK